MELERWDGPLPESMPRRTRWRGGDSTSISFRFSGHARYKKYMYLSAPASSAPCERIFSAAGQLYTAKRSSLKDDTAEMILRLHHNLLLVKKVLASL